MEEGVMCLVFLLHKSLVIMTLRVGDSVRVIQTGLLGSVGLTSAAFLTRFRLKDCFYNSTW